MAYEGPEIDTLFQLVASVGQPSFDRAKLTRPPVKIVLEIIKMANDCTAGAFPALAEVITDFTAEQKQERLDYIANVIQLVQQRVDRPFSCEAKDITGGKEVQNTLNMLIIMLQTAIQLKEQAHAPQTMELVHEEPVRQQEILATEPDADTVDENVAEQLATRLQDLLHLDISSKQLMRPPVKLLQEVFTGFNVATGGSFPPDEITVRTEFTKEQKEERQQYIENIIECVKQASGENISVQSKGITGGKAVGHTHYMLAVMCRICERILSGENIQIQHPEPEKPQQQYHEPEQPQEQAQFFNQMDNPSTDIFKQEPEPLEVPQLSNPAPERQNEIQQAEHAEKIKQVDEEEEHRKYLEAQRKQAEQEEAYKRRLTNAFQDVKTNEKSAFNRPPPSQQRKRQEMAVKAENLVVQKRIIEDSDDDNSKNEELPEAVDADFFGAAGQVQAGGAFSQDIIKTQNEYQQLLDDKQPGAKIVNQSNQKLLAAISDSIRRIIPISKATSFLEEHLVRMRQEQTAADDECLVEEQKLQKATSLDLKSRSVVDAKVRSVSDQLEQVRANFNELVQQGLML